MKLRILGRLVVSKKIDICQQGYIKEKLKYITCRIVLMIVNKIWNGIKTVVFSQVQFVLSICMHVVMFDGSFFITSKKERLLELFNKQWKVDYTMVK